MALKFCVSFDIKLHKKQDKLKKIRTRVSEDFLGLKVTTPQIWGSAEISTGLGVFLKILSCWIFLKKFLVTFYCFFVQFFSKNSQKVRVTNLAKMADIIKFFLETCYLRSLDPIYHILCHSIGFMIFCDMRNVGHKIEIVAKNNFFFEFVFSPKFLVTIKPIL